MLVGREAERARIGALLEGARGSRSGVLVLRGEAGAGKSALLAEAQAMADGMRVLRATGVESEAALPYAALHQVLRPTLGRLERLPAPQAAALRGAFGISAEAVSDRFLVSLGTLSLLADAAEEAPLLCLVDDAQWLDEPSAEALVFAARRLEAEGIAMLLAAREGEERRLDAPGLPELRVAGLEPGPARALLAERAGDGLAAGVRDHLVELTRGNPLALIELPAALTPEQLAGRAPLPEELPLTADLERAFARRAQGLSAAARTLLLVAALEETGDVATILAASEGLGVEGIALDEAEGSGLLRLGDGLAEFRHPLVRSALVRAAPFRLHQDAHRALVEALPGDENADRRAWHRAATASAPDEEAAAELERSAERAARRSGHAAAAAALERAARLSGDEPARARRLVAAAEAAWTGGRAERAAALLDEAGEAHGDPGLRARLLGLRGRIELTAGRLADAHAPLLEAAELEARADPAEALRTLNAAAEAASMAGRIDQLAAAAGRAQALPEADPFSAAFLPGVSAFLGGDMARGAPLLRRAMEVAAGLDHPRGLVWAGACAMFLADMDAARGHYDRAVAATRARGALALLPLALELRAASAVWEMRLPEAEADAEEGLRISREHGMRNTTAAHLALLAQVRAAQGREEARDLADEALALAAAGGIAVASGSASWALAMLALGHGRWDEALERLEAIASGRPGVGHPMLAIFTVPDRVEAAVRAGRTEALGDAPARFAAWAELVGAAWAAPLVARCRALLSEGAEAEEHYRRALDLHGGPGGRPYDRARTELVYGELLRRARRRTEARAVLRSALEAFEGLGAGLWADRARAELRATGERARRRDPSAAAALTPQELQIARVVAQGASNKEVAAQLFLSPKTVEYHLGKVFAKLGISSRTELAAITGTAESGP